MKPGFQVGALVEKDYGEKTGERKSMGFQTGLLISSQGTKNETTIFGQTTKETISVTYLQIPVNIAGKIDWSKMTFVYHAGPYLGIAIAGKYKIDEGREEKIKFGSGDDAYMKGFDFGFGAGAGFQFGNIQTKLGANYSLLNLTNKKDFKMQNLCLSLTAAYFFRK